MARTLKKVLQGTASKPFSDKKLKAALPVVKKSVTKSAKKTKVTPLIARSTSPLRLVEVKNKEKSTRITINDNTKSRSEKVEKNSVLSPVVPVIERTSILHRFPIPKTQFVGTFARNVGVLLVLVGGIFSLLHMPNSEGTYSGTQVAQTISGHETFTGVQDSNTASTVIDIQPSIRIQGDGVLAGSVPIQIIVPNALGVSVLFLHAETDSVVPVRATQVDASTWEYMWDTAEFLDGAYKVRTLITSDSATYEYGDSNSYEVLNESSELVDDVAIVEQSPEENSLAQSATSSTPEEISEADEEQDVFVSATSTRLLVEDGAVLSGTFGIDVIVPNASDVRLYARNRATDIFTYLGAGMTSDRIAWRVSVDSSWIQNGNYELYVKSIIDGFEHESGTVRVSIQNDSTALYESTSKGMGSNSFASTTKVDVPVSIEFPEGTLSGVIPIDINADGATHVALYVSPKNGTTEYYIGQGYKVPGAGWKFNWDSKQTPNGEYALFARVTQYDGTIESVPQLISVQNEMIRSLTLEQEIRIDELRVIRDSLITVVDSDLVESSIERERMTQYVESVGSFLDAMTVEDSERISIEQSLSDFRISLDTKLMALGNAERTGDAALVAAHENEVQGMKNDVLAQLFGVISNEANREKVTAYVEDMVRILLATTMDNEQILREQFTDLVRTDSDGEGLSDYEEVYRFATNPFAADTDGDGYTDHAEVVLGLNPYDSTAESRIVAESPLTTGSVKSDTISVDSIVTLTQDQEREEAGALKAVISGQGLPHSFVTLSIFSEPFVTTVRTDASGAWSYVLDADIEAGTHEVYATLVDNTGSIIAKSEKRSLIKTADAYIMADNSVPLTSTIDTNDDSLRTNHAMLLVASLCIVALGLVLILLGLHVHTGRKEKEQLLITP